MARLMLSLILVLSLLTYGAAFSQDGGQSFHHGMPGEKIDYEALFQGAVPLSKSDVGRDILDACMEAYGGREALAGGR